jgi:hypothetical protein
MRSTLRRRPWLLCEIHGTGAEVIPLLSRFGYRLRRLEGDGPVDGAADWLHVVATPG